jgi:hypothetical protein
MAGATSLETGAKMVPVTSPAGAQAVMDTVSQMQHIRLPGKYQELNLQAPTEFGPLDIHVEKFTDPNKHPAQLLSMLMRGSLHKKDLLTVNPESLELLQSLGPNLKGMGAVSFDWGQAPMGGEYAAPERGLGAGRSRSVLSAVKDVYQNQVVPTLMRYNPDSALLLVSSPVHTEGKDPLRRGRLYQRSGMMGPVDVHENQYSLILPSGKVHPLELFGGIPHPVL